MSRYIDEHRGRFGVEPTCRVLGVSASAYYQRATGARSARQVEDERLLVRIREIHQANSFAYGSRRMWKALRAIGEQVGRGRVERLMRTHGIQGAKHRGRPWRTTTPDPVAHRRPDLVDRDFTASEPNRLWVADFCHLRCWEGVVFFAFVIDVYSRRVVGLAVRAPHAHYAGARRPADGPRSTRLGRRRRARAHSDRGSQYTSIDYTQTLDDHGVLASVGSVGDAYDNALAESFVDTFKTEPIRDRVWRTRAQLELAIVEWVSWFNTTRMHSSLTDLSPLQFEEQSQVIITENIHTTTPQPT